MECARGKSGREEEGGGRSSFPRGAVLWVIGEMAQVP